MTRQSSLRRGVAVIAALAVTALGASGTPFAAYAQGSVSRLNVAIETANTSWSAASGSRLALRVATTNVDSSEPTGASVWIGLPRGVQDLRMLAPKGWSCGYDEVTDETVKVLCTAQALGPGETAQIFVNGRAPVAGGTYAIWTSAQAEAVSPVTSSALLTVSPPPSTPRPPIRPPSGTTPCPSNVCV